MNTLAKYGAGVGLVCVAAFIGSNALKQDRAAAMERFALTDLEAPIMQACEATVSRHNIEFKSGVQNIIGCGCIAREIANAVPVDGYAAMTSVAAAIIAGGDPETGAEEFDRGLRAAQSAHGLSDARLLGHIDTATSAIAHCSKPESHMTDAELASAADARREQYENSKLAFAQLVAEGHMTRAEADARLARMQQ